MKSKINLQICNQMKVKLPTTEMIGNKIIVSWKYQSLSWACQGNWNEKTWTYSKNKFDFNSMIKEVEKYIVDFFGYHENLSHLNQL